MTFSQYAGTAILPTLSRLVLCAAFLTAGWHKVFDTIEYTAEQEATLRAAGVNLQPKATAMAPGDRNSTLTAVILPASHRQDAPLGSLRDRARESAQDQTSPSTQPETAPAESEPLLIPVDPPPSAATDTAPTIAGGVYTGKAKHMVTLAVHNAGWPRPRLWAEVASFTELIGGAMMLLGLFSRFWGLGLAIGMGVAFYLTSMNAYFETGPFAVGQGRAVVDGVIQSDGFRLFNTVFCQLGLGMLAFGVFLTGAGPLSLDRLLFGRTKEVVIETEEQVKLD